MPKRWIRILSRSSRATGCVDRLQPAARLTGLQTAFLQKNFKPRRIRAQEDTAMSKLSKANLVALRSLIAAGAMLSMTAGVAMAGEEITADQIAKALAPAPQKPLTRGLSRGPQADPPKS